MRTLSNITHEYYTNEDCVFFRNALQSAKYMSWGATLVDLFIGSEDKMVFVFLYRCTKRTSVHRHQHKGNSNNGLIYE